MQNTQKVRGKRWTTSEIVNMVAYYREGNNIEEIAVKINRTPGGVAARLFKEKEIEKISDARGYKFVEQKKESSSDIMEHLTVITEKLEEMSKKMDLLLQK